MQSLLQQMLAVIKELQLVRNLNDIEVIREERSESAQSSSAAGLSEKKSNSSAASGYNKNASGPVRDQSIQSI